MADILLFLWHKYTSQTCKLATRIETKAVCFVKYYTWHLLRHWQVYELPSRKLQIMEQPCL